jgi:hypothetical protein
MGDLGESHVERAQIGPPYKAELPSLTGSDRQGSSQSARGDYRVRSKPFEPAHTQ